jgi:hypothetical protein
VAGEEEGEEAEGRQGGREGRWKKLYMNKFTCLTN